MKFRRLGFAADFETSVVSIDSKGVRQESREWFRLYRDASGRTRMEGTSGTLRFAFLTDPQTRRAIVIDLETGKPLESNQPPKPTAMDCVGYGSQLETETEDLGEAEIEGLAARGIRITTGVSTVEVWTAAEIDQPPLLVRRKEPLREETQRLFNIRAGDPDSELFAPLDERTDRL